MDTSNWGWPQFTYIILIVLSLLFHAGDHGKPRTPENAFVAFVGAAVTLFLLTAGGFFS